MALSRRDFFRRGLAEALRDVARAARRAGEALEPVLSSGPPPPRGTPSPKRLLRPPGALDEEAFLARCTLCDDCLHACPRHAIRRAGPEYGARNEGTPTIVPFEQPCWLCPELPCIDACEPGALAPLARPDDARMGWIRILEERCFSVTMSYCDTCVDRCPVDPKPIAVESGSLPTVDASRCAGCGVCVWLCPATAIELIPGAPPAG